MIKKYLDCLRQVVKRVELLEFIAISQHPDLVKKFKEIKKWITLLYVHHVKKMLELEEYQLNVKNVGVEIESRN